MTPQEHHQKWQNCQQCLLHLNRSQVVTFRGESPCDVLLVGEAPGRSEDALGSPFVGESGYCLKDIIEVCFNQHCKVVHHKVEEYDLLIDRRTKWGNPFKLKEAVDLKSGDFTVDRETAIAKYETYLSENPSLLKAIPELCDKVMGCWCKPKACHGDVLVEYVNKRYPSLRVGISNICCCLPLGDPEVEGGLRPIRAPERAEAEACRPRLLELIKITKPRAIVALGKVPAKFLPKIKDGLPPSVQFIEEAMHPSALLRLQREDPVRYQESYNRTILTLTRLKYRLWNLEQ